MHILAALQNWFLSYWRGTAADRSARERIEGRTTMRHARRMRDGFIWWPSRPGYPAQSCRIKDVSFKGASVQLATPLKDEALWSGPTRLYCTVEKQEYVCKTAWRKGSLIGLQFEGGPRPPSRSF